jgi:hypothetical protein
MEGVSHCCMTYASFAAGEHIGFEKHDAFFEEYKERLFNDLGRRCELKKGKEAQPCPPAEERP